MLYLPVSFRAEKPQKKNNLKLKMSDGYDPQKSRIADDKLADFLRAPLTGDIQEVPGIGPAAAKHLASGDDINDQVHNTYQLVGKYLMLKVRTVETL